MRKDTLLISVIMAVVLPYLIFAFWEGTDDSTQIMQPELQEQHLEAHMIRVNCEGIVEVMELDSYVTGVVLGEMPAEFEFEALKAQAVATRTYTLRNVMRSGKHSGADVCTDPTCCQAYISADAYVGVYENYLKIKRAVDATSNQVITYQDNLIEATYFSCSGGQTEDAVAVWGTDVPYLQSVSSPGEEKAKHFTSKIEFTIQEFRSKLGLPESAVISNESMKLMYTDGDGVKTMIIDGHSFSGVQVRTLLSLPSASFSVSISNENIVISTKGNGHRVGMSQYGADAMALKGKLYDEILTHYYTGTQVVKLSDDQLYAIFDKEENL